VYDTFINVLIRLSDLENIGLDISFAFIAVLVWKLWRFSLYSTSHGGHLELGHKWLTGQYHKCHNWIPWPQKHRIWCFICIYSSISKGDMTHFDIRRFERRPSWIRPYLGWYHWANFGKLFILAYRPIFLPISVEKQNKAIFSNWTGFFYFIYWTIISLNIKLLRSENPFSIQKHKWLTQTWIILIPCTYKGERVLKSIRHGFEPSSRSRERSILPLYYQAINVWVLDNVLIWTRYKGNISLDSICTLGCQ